MTRVPDQETTSKKRLSTILFFGEDRYSLTLYLKTSEICGRVSQFLDNKQLEPIHRRNLYFYVAMYATCEITASGYANPGKIEVINLEHMTDAVLEKCLIKVQKRYETLAEKSKVGDDKDYDSVAKGPQLLKAVLAELKRRFNKKPS
jgi:hypothetical protein